MGLMALIPPGSIDHPIAHTTIWRVSGDKVPHVNGLPLVEVGGAEVLR